MQTTASTPTRPLGRFPVLRTDDLEEAREAVTRIYLPHDLAPTGDDDAALGMELNAVDDRNLTVGFLTYGAGTRLTMPATQDSYHVNLTTRGATFADREDGDRAWTRARYSGVVLLPDQLNRVRWTADAEQLILKISRGTLEAHLADLLGRPSGAILDFDFQFDLTGPRGRSLLASVEFLAAELDRPGGIADLARVGSMSVRTLHASFQQTFGISPMVYLRGVRLGYVRAELTSGRDHDVRITDVAMRWGFFHPSRFAQQYRRRYGELPSETVRRCAPI